MKAHRRLLSKLFLTSSLMLIDKEKTMMKNVYETPVAEELTFSTVNDILVISGEKMKEKVDPAKSDKNWDLLDKI